MCSSIACAPSHAERFGVPRDIESAFGGDLFALFGDERDLVRAEPHGDAEHVLGAGHFEVERDAEGVHEPIDVGILDVPAVFAEVCGDAVGAGALAELGGGDRIRLVGTARLTERRHVIDVDIEAHDRGRFVSWG